MTNSSPIPERREDPSEPIVFRPWIVIRLGGMAICLLVAAPSLMAFFGMLLSGSPLEDRLNATSILLPVFFAALGLYFAWRIWILSAEVDDREFRYHGLLYSQTFDLATLGGIREIYQHRSRYHVVVDELGNTLANAATLRLLHDYERLYDLMRYPMPRRATTD